MACARAALFALQRGLCARALRHWRGIIVIAIESELAKSRGREEQEWAASAVKDKQEIARLAAALLQERRRAAFATMRRFRSGVGAGALRHAARRRAFGRLACAAAVHRARTAADVASAALRKRVDAEHGQHRAERERAEGLQAQLRAQRSAAEAATAAAAVAADAKAAKSAATARALDAARDKVSRLRDALSAVVDRQRQTLAAAEGAAAELATERARGGQAAEREAKLRAELAVAVAAVAGARDGAARSQEDARATIARLEAALDALGAAAAGRGQRRKYPVDAGCARKYSAFWIAEQNGTDSRPTIPHPRNVDFSFQNCVLGR